jgi:formylglycine-generating enzyme required for sulfatase activity
MRTAGDLALVVLALAWGCTTATTNEDAPATTPAPASTPTVESASLRITARDVDGRPIAAAVWLGDRQVAEAAQGEPIAVPAGRHRLRVAAADKGAFLEDVELVVGAVIERDVVLAPGPDMLRLPGGRFTLGPPAGDEWPGIERWDVELAPFDLDLTEVTVADYVACRKAAKQPICNTEAECANAVGCPYHYLRAPEDPRDWVLPKNADLPLCNLHPGLADLKVASGRERHPANCVTRFEAEDYCRWAGKRLPTDAEWEFAAQGVAPTTGAKDRSGTSPVCERAGSTSARGICDLMANVSEYVDDAVVPGRPRRPSRRIDGCRGSAWYGIVDASFRPASCGDFEGMPWFGFRCARDAKAGGK